MYICKGKKKKKKVKTRGTGPWNIRLQGTVFCNQCK